MESAKEIVEKWHDALNRGDVENLLAWVHPEVVVGGPRGKTSGLQVVRQWFGRANIRLIPLAYFTATPIGTPTVTRHTIVVEEQGEWLDPANGQIVGNQRVSTIFTVADNLITSIIRHDQLETALSEAGITPP